MRGRTPINQMFHPDNKEEMARVANARKRVAAIIYITDMLGWQPPENTSTEELVKICRGVKNVATKHTV